MPCGGCRDQVEKIMVKLRFIGKPGGKLVKGAPGNYKQGQIVVGPSSRVENFPRIWELAEELPTLIIPKAGEVDSVFDPSHLEIPSEGEDIEIEVEIVTEVELESEPLVEVEEEPIKLSREYNLLDPNRESTHSFHRIDADSSEDHETIIEEITLEDLEKYTRHELMDFIELRDGKYKKNMRKPELLDIAKSLL